MNKLKSFLQSRVFTTVLFVAAAALFLAGGIRGTLAALSYSDTYTSRVEMKRIGISLIENKEVIASRDYSASGDGTWVTAGGTLLSKMLGDGETLKLGVKYPEAIAVKNSGNIDEYVRVKIYRYWVDSKGNKLTERPTDPIELNLLDKGSWVIDKNSSTAERTILYYTKVLAPGETTEDLSDTLKINDIIATKVTQTVKKDGNFTTTTTVYDYDGISFVIEAEADAVQTHSAEDAILSAWGCKVSIEDGVLSLVG